MINSLEKLKGNSDGGRGNRNVPGGVRSQKSDSTPTGRHSLADPFLAEYLVTNTTGQALPWERPSPCP